MVGRDPPMEFPAHGPDAARTEPRTADRPRIGEVGGSAVSVGYLPKLATARERERIKALVHSWLDKNLLYATREQLHEIEKAFYPESKTLPVDR